MDQATLAATRVAAGDDRTRYDPPAMALHWLTALLVLTLWTLAQAWDFLQRGTPARHELQALHVSLGLVLIVVLAARIAWRAGPSRRLPPAATGVVELAARGMHYLLYALLIAEVVLGVCLRWSGPDPLSFFGLFTIPSPFAFTKEQGHTIHDIPPVGRQRDRHPGRPARGRGTLPPLLAARRRAAAHAAGPPGAPRRGRSAVARRRGAGGLNREAPR